MRHLYVFMGKSATGKDTLFNEALRSHPKLHRVVTYTTRPIREGETDGDEYHFVDEAKLEAMRRDGRVIEERRYDTARGTWYYFTAADDEVEMSAADFAMITTLEGYKHIRDYFGEANVTPIYIEVDDSTRIERAIKREKKQETPCIAEVCRRYLADEEDFSEENLRAERIIHRIINDDKQAALSQIDKILENKVDL